MTQQPEAVHIPASFLTMPDQKPRRCGRCSLWFIEGNVMCAAIHGPNECCHYRATEVPAPPGNIGDPTHFTAFITRAIEEDLRTFDLMARVETPGSDRSVLIGHEIGSLQARLSFLASHQPSAAGNCRGCGARWPCSGICDLSAWAEYPG